MNTTSPQQAKETPKTHPRNTPAPSMEALRLIDAIEAMLHELPKLSKGEVAPRMIHSTPALIAWIEQDASNYPAMKEFVLGNMNNFVEQSILMVVQLLEEGVPPRIALGLLSNELLQMLEFKLQRSLTKAGCTD